MRRSFFSPVEASIQAFLRAFCLALVIASGFLVPVHAQAGPTAAAESDKGGSGVENSANPNAPEQKPEANSTEKYRHSPAVQWIARTLNISVENAATIFEDLNFGILAASILYFLIKLLPRMFSARKAALAKQLLDARTATDEANQRLGGVEARLARLDDDIAAIRRQVEQDAVQDEARIKAALQEETRRIAEAAGHEVEAAGAAAQRELRKFAAELAIERATSQLSLTAEIDRRLVSSFARELAGDSLRPDSPDPFNGDRLRGGHN